MKRLTKRYEGGMAYVSLDSVSALNDECVGLPITKLAKYEDLEEQGLLLKLPCKVGDTAYVFLPNDNHLTVAQINKIEVKPTIYGKMCYFIEPVSFRGHLYRYFEDDFGKTVFLTQAEAEEALKKMNKTEE